MSKGAYIYRFPQGGGFFMDDNKEKRKESIDEILSDLNGLLNKMPSILDGIKMPEMQPPEFPKPAQQPAPPEALPADKIPAESFDGDKTVVLEPFSGLSEGSQVPGDITGETIPVPAGPDIVDSSAEEVFAGLPENSGTPAEVPGETVSAEPLPAPADAFDGDKTVVLESFSGLTEGSQAPAEIPGLEEPEPSPAAAEEPVVLESFSPAPEWSEPVQDIGADNIDAPVESGQEAGRENVAPEPEPVTLKPQSLGDFMFGENSGDAPEEPASSAPAALPGEEVSHPEIAPKPVTEAALPEMQQAKADDMFFAQDTPDPVNSEEAAPEKHDALPEYDNTRDFGVPDIDALMKMSEGGKPAGDLPDQAGPEAGMIPESVQFIEEQKDGPTFPELADLEPQPPAPASEGENMEDKDPEEDKTEIRPPEEAFPSAEPEALIIEPESKPESSFEAFTIEPAPAETEQEAEKTEAEQQTVSDSIPDQTESEGLKLETAFESMGGTENEPDPAEPGQEASAETELQAEPQAEIKLEAPSGTGVSPEPSAEPSIEVNQPIQFGSGAEPASGSGIELSPGIELGAGSPSQSLSPDETLPGGRGMELAGPDSQTSSGDETMVVQPLQPSADSGEETVVFQAGPATTSRAQAKDLASLAATPVPEGIPEDRVRSLVFLYSPGDEALCATVLAELDSICLKSATKPMFIKRAYVKACDIDSNANFVHQSVADSGAVGLVCIGDVPQDKVYEIENVFASSGGFFRYYDSSTFTHSSALDLITDLILR